MGAAAKFPADLHDGHAQLWSWDYDPDDGWVYVVSTGFQRDKGIILRRVRPAGIGDASQYETWGRAGNRWAWGNDPTLITPDGETWGELSFRRFGKGSWVLGGFLSSQYALGYRTLGQPVSPLTSVPIQTPVVGCGLGRGEPHRLPGGPTVRRLPAAGFTPGHPRRRRIGCVALEYESRVAVPGDAVPHDTARHLAAAPRSRSGRPDQPLALLVVVDDLVEGVPVLRGAVDLAGMTTRRTLRFRRAGGQLIGFFGGEFLVEGLSPRGPRSTGRADPPRCRRRRCAPHQNPATRWDPACCRVRDRRSH